MSKDNEALLRNGRIPINGIALKDSVSGETLACARYSDLSLGHIYITPLGNHLERFSETQAIWNEATFIDIDEEGDWLYNPEKGKSSSHPGLNVDEVDLEVGNDKGSDGLGDDDEGEDEEVKIREPPVPTLLSDAAGDDNSKPEISVTNSEEKPKETVEGEVPPVAFRSRYRIRRTPVGSESEIGAASDTVLQKEEDNQKEENAGKWELQPVKAGSPNSKRTGNKRPDRSPPEKQQQATSEKQEQSSPEKEPQVQSGTLVPKLSPIMRAKSPLMQELQYSPRVFFPSKEVVFSPPQEKRSREIRNISSISDTSKAEEVSSKRHEEKKKVSPSKTVKRESKIPVRRGGRPILPRKRRGKEKSIVSPAHDPRNWKLIQWRRHRGDSVHDIKVVQNELVHQLKLASEMVGTPVSRETYSEFLTDEGTDDERVKENSELPESLMIWRLDLKNQRLENVCSSDEEGVVCRLRVFESAKSRKSIYAGECKVVHVCEGEFVISARVQMERSKFNQALFIDLFTIHGSEIIKQVAVSATKQYVSYVGSFIDCEDMRDGIAQMCVKKMQKEFDIVPNEDVERNRKKCCAIM